MTPKQKAEELVNKFIPLCGMELTEIQCALVAVDEIIKTLKPPCLTEFDYWQQVKQEITNL